jgi:hypothetical protein
VIVEDGYVSFVVWGPKEANPFFSTVTDVIDRFVEVPKQDPDAPDAFRFAVPGKLAGILVNAEAENVIERQLKFQIEAESHLSSSGSCELKCPKLCAKKWLASRPLNYQP